MVKTGDIDPINMKNLKALENGGTIDYVQVGGVVAIGKGHKKEVVELLEAKKNSDMYNKGKLTITKGKLTDPGTVTVSGVHSERAQFDNAIKRISKKTVKYS